MLLRGETAQSLGIWLLSRWACYLGCYLRRDEAYQTGSQTESQRAMAAAKVANLRRGGDRRSEDFKAPIDALKSHADAGQMFKVSRSSVQRAAVVREHGVPELIAAVEQGDVPVSAAVAVATLPEAEQVKVVEAGEVRQTASRVRGGSGNGRGYRDDERCGD